MELRVCRVVVAVAYHDVDLLVDVKGLTSNAADE